MEIGDRNWGGRCAALLGSSGFAGYQNSYLLSHISYLCDNKKRLSSHPWDERRILPRYHPDSRQKRRALVAPVTEGGPAVSPRRLPGEPNQASTVWLAAGDQTSLGGGLTLFSRSSRLQLSFISHWRENCKMVFHTELDKYASEWYNVRQRGVRRPDRRALPVQEKNAD